MIKNKVLLKTNMFICIVIILGFLVTSIVTIALIPVYSNRI